MKKFFSCFVALFLSSIILAQSGQYRISGQILDSITQKPLPKASVFAQNTTIGTATDDNGNFKLELPNGGYDLVVTYTGYETEVKRITSGDVGKDFVIILKQKDKTMQEVAIKASSEVKDGWEKYGSFFLENFIGKTLNGDQCIIKNKDSLRFYFSKRKNRLKVLSDAPIEIDNNALGYKIKYTLDSFAYDYNVNTSVYTGFPLFEEMTTNDEAQKLLWSNNRKKAYDGSLLQFMRNIYDENLNKDEFEIQLLAKNGDMDEAIIPKDIYEDLNFEADDSAEIVKITPKQKNLAIIYKKEKPDSAYTISNPQEPTDFQLTYLFFLDAPSIVIEQNGYYYEQNDVTFNGWMAWEKVADMLPYDFEEE